MSESPLKIPINADMLSQRVWAKTSRPLEGEPLRLMPLSIHMKDSADAALNLLKALPGHTQRTLRESFPTLDLDEIFALLSFIIGVHDAGKATAQFQKKSKLADPELCGSYVYHSEEQERPHSFYSTDIIRRFLLSKGVNGKVAKALSQTANGHHGSFANEGDLRKHSSIQVQEPWRTIHQRLLEEALKDTGATQALTKLSDRPIPHAVQTFLCGLTTKADWAASNGFFFPFITQNQSPESRRRLGQQRMEIAGPVQFKQQRDHAAALRTRFDLPQDASPRLAQRLTLQAVDEMSTPELILIEAPTGTGKTEAGLLAAERLAEKLDLDGIYFALPTMATSDAIFDRTVPWAESVQHDAKGDLSVYLAHSKRHLQQTWAELQRAAQLERWDSTRELSRKPRPHSWLAEQRLLGLHSNIVVGTIDQVLFLALRARHVCLRHAGMFSKVVILDEVHAADPYMLVYLERALEWLSAMRLPVILMTATLPPSTRQSLLNAYKAGTDARIIRDKRTPRGRIRAWKKPHLTNEVVPGAEATTTHEFPYPVITTTAGNHYQSAENLPVEKKLHFSKLDDQLNSLLGLIRDKASKQGVIGIICNTVRRAQEAFEFLRTHLEGDIELIHSRFLAPDRAAKEQRLVAELGPPHKVQGSGRSRPEFKIVIGTQVLEQSLDIDFDLMISDIAPLELMFQRVGRLHRHNRMRPEGLEDPTCYVRGVRDWAGPLPQVDEGCTAVYPEYLLQRALLVLDQQGGWNRDIAVPEEVPKFVAFNHEEQLCSSPTSSAWAELRRSHERSLAEERRFAKSFLVHSPSAQHAAPLLPDSIAAYASAGDELDLQAGGRRRVRNTSESLEVILLAGQDDYLQLFDWQQLEHRQFSSTLPLDDPSFEREIAMNTIRLPRSVVNEKNLESRLEELERNRITGFAYSQLLKGELVIVLDESLSYTFDDGRKITYNPDIGLTDGKAT